MSPHSIDHRDDDDDDVVFLTIDKLDIAVACIETQDEIPDPSSTLNRFLSEVVKFNVGPGVGGNSIVVMKGTCNSPKALDSATLKQYTDWCLTERAKSSKYDSKSIEMNITTADRYFLRCNGEYAMSVAANSFEHKVLLLATEDARRQCFDNLPTKMQSEIYLQMAHTTSRAIDGTLFITAQKQLYDHNRGCMTPAYNRICTGCETVVNLNATYCKNDFCAGFRGLRVVSNIRNRHFSIPKLPVAVYDDNKSPTKRRRRGIPLKEIVTAIPSNMNLDILATQSSLYCHERIASTEDCPLFHPNMFTGGCLSDDDDEENEDEENK